MNETSKFASRAKMIFISASFIMLLSEYSLPGFEAKFAGILFFSLTSRIFSVINNTRLKAAFFISNILQVVFLQAFMVLNAYLLVNVILIDGYVEYERYRKIITAFLIGVLFFLMQSKSPEIIIIETCIFFTLSILAFQMRRLNLYLKEIAGLYDENRKYSYQLEFEKKRALEFIKVVEDFAQNEERDRISKELHDSLGHKLTGVLMQLDANIRLIKRDISEGTKLLDTVRGNLSNCIDIMRNTVRSMRPKTFSSGIAAIGKLAEEFRVSTGVRVEISMEGIPYYLGPDIEVAIFNNAREAMTNSVRHGKAKNILIELSYMPDRIVLTVGDDGEGCADIIKGMGISGMEERARMLGGKLMVQGDKGFWVITVIPIM